MKPFFKSFFSIHNLPSVLSCLIFGTFFFSFFSLSSQYGPLSTRATAAITPLWAICYPQVKHPAYLPYQSFFPARILYEPRYLSHKALGPNFKDLYAKTPIFHVDFAWTELINRLEADGLDRNFLLHTFASLGLDSYSPQYMAAKIYELYRVGSSTIESQFSPGELIPQGYKKPLEKISVGKIIKFSKDNKSHFDKINKEYGVPQDLIMSILLIETSFGTNLGRDSALRVLGSLAATNSRKMLAYNGPTRQTEVLNPNALSRTLKARSEWAYKELFALLKFGKQNKINVAKLPGSKFGAIGLCQFMPSNIEPFAVDGDGDDKINLFQPIDAMYSIANYLKKHGWSSSGGNSHQLSIVYTYNHDYTYANNVLALANVLRAGRDGKVALSRNPLNSISWNSTGDIYLAKRQRSNGKAFIAKNALHSYIDFLK